MSEVGNEASEIDPTSLLAGTAYDFVRPLGRGGMGIVVEAEHRELQKRVVVKLLHADLERPELVERLRFEAQALARTSHENLVNVTDFGSTSTGRTFFAMELLQGRSLREELVERRWLPIGEAVGVARQALAGLHAAHEMGVVHRDVKPGNIFLCAGSGLVKLIDFGIAKLVAPDQSSLRAPRFATRDGTALGTPRYIAPEQIRGEAVTPATDVYAMGLVVYEMLTGRAAFGGARTVDELFAAQLLEMPEFPSRVADQPVPAGMDQVVLRAVAKLPGQRFASAKLFSEALDAELAGRVPALAERDPVTEIGDSEKAPSLLLPATLAVTHAGTRNLEPDRALFAPRPPARKENVWWWIIAGAVAVMAAGVVATVLGLGSYWISNTGESSRFDATTLLPAARAKAREQVPNADLVSFSARGLGGDGLGNKAWFKFRSVSGGGERCSVEVYVTPLAGMKSLNADSKDCDAPLAPPPRCTLREVMDKARRAGLSGDDLEIEYHPPFPGSKAWRVQRSANEPALDLLDDCR